MRSPGHELAAALGAAVPADHARQTLADDYIAAVDGRVLDLGCGTGDSVDGFRAADPGVDWTGLDVERSREVGERTRSDARFVSFDGETIPFDDDTFALVYCKQVLEHVARPGIDGATLLAHRLFAGGRMGPRWGRWWRGPSPLNRAIDWHGRLARLDARAVNANKLLFGGQFAFCARPAAGSSPAAAARQ